MSQTHKYPLADVKPDTWSGGSIAGASAKQFPIADGKGASMYIARLDPGGVREPHWHPNGWEFGYCVQGESRWMVLGPQGDVETFTARAGDATFMPQGHYHYFENIGSEELIFVLVFNTSQGEAEDDIGLAAAFGALPATALAAVFGTSIDAVQAIPKIDKIVKIASEKDIKA
jgi:oxalate decarboxylase